MPCACPALPPNGKLLKVTAYALPRLPTTGPENKGLQELFVKFPGCGMDEGSSELLFWVLAPLWASVSPV